MFHSQPMTPNIDRGHHGTDAVRLELLLMRCLVGLWLMFLWWGQADGAPTSRR